MREYLFRGKSLDTGKWVYGYFVRLCHYLYENDRSKDRYVIIPVDSELYPRNEISYLIEVYPETVGQWTGLADKNGVKIFEGDVVRYITTYQFLYGESLHEHIKNNPNKAYISQMEVTYKNGEFIPRPVRDNCDDYWYSTAKLDFEVIGNKLDNPELVK